MKPITYLRHATLFREELKNTFWWLLHQFKALSVVSKGDVGKFDSLLMILE